MKKRVLSLLLGMLMILAMLPNAAFAQTDGVMIYEVYTSGGYTSGKSNAAPYRNCYVVLYNGSAETVDLTGWSLRVAPGTSDQIDVSRTVELGGSIGGFGFYVIQGGTCVDPGDPPAGEALPFDIDVNAPNLSLVRKSGKIALCNAAGAAAATVHSNDGFVVDFFGYGDTAEDINDYETNFRDNITVKKVARRVERRDTNNNQTDFTIVDIVDNPDKIEYFKSGKTAAPLSTVSFSVPAGYYKNAFTLSLSTDIVGQHREIYYTIDGSDPLAQDGTVLPGAIRYEDGAKINISDRTGQPSNLLFRDGTTDKTKDNPFTWPPKPAKDESLQAYETRMNEFYNGIFKINSIKAMAKNEYGHVSVIGFNSYIISEKDIAQRFDLPVVCITTDQKNLYDPQRGIWMFENVYKSGADWEREAQLQFFEENGKLGFEDTIGLRLHGGYTRIYPQKAIRVYLDHTLNYDLFDSDVKKPDGSTVMKFDEFLLRSSGNDWYSTAMRDAFAHKLSESIGTFQTVGYRPCVTFINGELWGIYDIRERQEPDMFANRYDIAKKDVAIVEAFISLKDGEEGDQLPLYNLAKFTWDNDMSQPQNYQKFIADFKAIMDVESYIDYMATVIFTGNTDWPHNNLRLWRNKNPENGVDTKWKMLLNDMDYAFAASSTPSHDTLKWAMTAPENKAGEILNNMMKDQQFRERFVAQFDELMRTYLKPTYMRPIFEQMQQRVSVATPEHRARWNLYMGELTKGDAYVYRYFDERAPVMYRAMQRNVSAVFFETDSEQGSIQHNGIEVGTVGRNHMFAGETSRLHAVPKAGYVFAGFEFHPIDSEEVYYSVRNNASYTPETGGVYKAVFVKEGDPIPTQFQSGVSDTLKKKLSSSLVFILGVAEGYINNQTKPIEETDVNVRPMTVEGRTLVPARFITENLGGTVTWNDATQTGVCTIGKNVVQFVLDSNIMLVNGKEVVLDVPAQTVSGRTLLPLRAFCESLGMVVFWDDARELIVISPSQQSYTTSEMDEMVQALKG